MKKFVVILSALASISAGKAEAIRYYHSDEPSKEFEPYIHLNLGFNEANDNLKYALIYSGAVGYRPYPEVRVELELAYRDNDSKRVQNIVGFPLSGSGNTKLTNLMINGYYDFINETKFTPYIGAGAGWGYREVTRNYTDGINTVSIDNTTSNFVFQLASGGAYEVRDNVEVTAGIRFLNTFNDDIPALVNGVRRKVNDDYSAFEALGGVKIKF